MDNEMERRLERINRQLAGEEFAAVHRNLYNNRDGVILKGDGRSCSPIIYFDNQIWRGTDQEIVDYMKMLYRVHGEDKDVEEIQTKEYILGHVLPGVARGDIIPELEKAGVSFVSMMDMAVYFYVPLKEALQNDDTLSSFKVLDDLLKVAGISLDELCHAAKDNAAQECVIKSLPAVLKEFFGTGYEEDAGEPLILLVSNCWNVNGAGLIYSEKVLEKIGDMLGPRFFIFPSSIHELICLPASTLDPEECLNLVVQINADHVHPEDRLTDSVYIWDNESLVCHTYKKNCQE